jgi:CRISPR-associated protein Cas2
MLVVVANHLPPAVRGRMKLWFTEVKPNIFVSGVKDSVAKKVINYLYDHCPPSSGLLVITPTSKTPGYSLRWLGELSRELIEISGLQLVIEKNEISKKL